ncbi:Uncharacterised protein [Bordetella pertussis]|nr:Uncharacterised protein [Bordetella pertussis]
MGGSGVGSACASCGRGASMMLTITASGSSNSGRSVLDRNTAPMTAACRARTVNPAPARRASDVCDEKDRPDWGLGMNQPGTLTIQPDGMHDEAAFLSGYSEFATIY